MYNSTVESTLAVVIPRVRATMGSRYILRVSVFISEQLGIENKPQDWMIRKGRDKKKKEISRRK